MIKNRLQNIRKNRLVRSVVIVASGTAGAQAIGMIFVPIVTRLYGPEVYGTLGAFIALTFILASITSLSYPDAIVLPRSDNTAKSIVKLSIIIGASISSSTLFILLLTGDWIMSKLGTPNLGNSILLIPVVMFLVACQDVAQQWLTRKKDFKGLAKVFIAHSFINSGLQVLAGLYAPISVVLISVYTLAIAIRTVLTGYIGKKFNNRPISNSEGNIALKFVAYKYRDFPIYRAPQAILNALSQSFPLLMLTAFFGPASAGFYALTRTVLGLPATLIGSSVQSVFYPHFNEAVIEKKQTLPLLAKATISLVIIGIWPFLLLILFGPYLFSFVFGNEWSQAGKYAQWLSLWSFFILISRPVVSSIPVFKIQRWFLGYEIVSGILRFFIIWLVFKLYSDELMAIAAYSVVGSVMYITLIIKVFFCARKFDRELRII